jgi:hypothetical protein
MHSGAAQEGNIQGSLKALHKSLELSSKLDESSGDVDVLGAIGDAYTDLGDLEKAAEVSLSFAAKPSCAA